MAKKKKDTPKKAVVNEVVEEKDTVKENFVDLMKEVSMQEEVDTIVEESDIKDIDVTSQEQNNSGQVNDNSDIIEKDIENEDSIEESISDKLNELEKTVDSIMTDVLVDDSISDNLNKLEKMTEIEEKMDSMVNSISIDEVIDDVKNNNDTKPRMTYRQMMGYDWNGQNFDYV